MSKEEIKAKRHLDNLENELNYRLKRLEIVNGEIDDLLKEVNKVYSKKSKTDHLSHYTSFLDDKAREQYRLYKEIDKIYEKIEDLNKN